MAALLALAMQGVDQGIRVSVERDPKPEKDPNDPAQAEKIAKAEAKRQRRAAKRRSE